MHAATENTTPARKTLQLRAQVAIIGVGRVLNMLAAAGTLMVLARVLPDRDSYGALCQLIIMYMALSAVFAVGLPQSTYYFLPRYEGGQRRGFLLQTIVLLLLSGTLLGIGLYFGADVLGEKLRSPQLPALLRVFALYPIFMLPTMAVEGTLMHGQRPVAVVFYALVVRLSMFASLVVPTLLGAPLLTAVTIWVAMAGIMGVVAIVLMLSTVRRVPVVWERHMLREEFGFSLPLALSTIISTAMIYMDRVFVSHYFGAEAFGIYTNGTIEIPTVTVVLNSVSVVLMAEFSRRMSMNDEESVTAIWHRAMLRIAVLIFASLGFLAFWSHETMRLFFSDRFADSGIIFAIYLWSIPVQLFILHPLFVSHGATRMMVWLSIFGLPLEFVCLVVGGKLGGLPGMAAGTLAARYLGTVIAIHLYTHRVTKVGWLRFAPWKMLLGVLLLAVLAGGASRLLHFAPVAWPMPLRYALALLGFLGLYAAAMHRIGMLDYVLPARFRRGQPESARDATTEVPL